MEAETHSSSDVVSFNGEQRTNMTQKEALRHDVMQPTVAGHKLPPLSSDDCLVSVCLGEGFRNKMESRWFWSRSVFGDKQCFKDFTYVQYRLYLVVNDTVLAICHIYIQYIYYSGNT